MKLKVTFFDLFFLAILTLPTLIMAATKAASQNPGLSSEHSTLTTADWNAVCTSGSPTAPTGCLGNASSSTFQKISNGTGGFTSWANIQPMNAPESVFVKAFLAGTNTPVAPPNININVPAGAARCSLFTTQGESIGINGINNLNPTPGNSLTQQAPFGLIIALNTSDGGFSYEHLPAPFEADPQDPIYVMCVAYDPADGASAISTAGSITAI